MVPYSDYEIILLYYTYLQPCAAQTPKKMESPLKTFDIAQGSERDVGCKGVI